VSPALRRSSECSGKQYIRTLNEKEQCHFFDKNKKLTIDEAY